ncbi:MAG: hypothetical protein NTU47_03150 [Ignavibacteriales bacterium]|nr:hypothetical protein [Ignavibacteriales bacterium]
MTKMNWENGLLVLLTIVVAAIVGYRFYESELLGGGGQLSPQTQEDLWASGIEGVNIMEVFRDDPTALKRISCKTSWTHPNFVVVLTDSSCRPCFGNLIKEYLIGLRENKCEIDPAQWIGIFCGKDTALGEATFRGVFGTRAPYFNVSALDRRVLLQNDSIILLATSDKTVLACSRIGSKAERTRSVFIRRAANALHAPEAKDHIKWVEAN